MCVIRFSGSWNTTADVSRSGPPKLVPNHESNLTDEDMKKLVLQVLDIPGMKSPPTEMDQLFKDMSARLLSDTGEVIVVKGIHQRDTDVHFTMNIYPISGAGYEVFLSAVDRPTDSKSTALARFEYKPVGITSTVKQVLKKWPATFTYANREDHGGIGIGRPRGSSISVGNSSAVTSVTL